MDVQCMIDGKYLVVPMKDRTGRDVMTVILKRTFAVGPSGRVEFCEDGAEVDLIDTSNGEDPGKSSIRRPSQLFDHKPGTDVILLGHAHPPVRRTVGHVDVSVRVGEVQKTVRAHGLRVWHRGTFGGISPGPALPIREPVPLVYELAWGGMDDTDPLHPQGEARNYVGLGISRDPGALVDGRAAQLEYPDHPIGTRNNVPASFGAIHRHWQPRASFTGTFDQAWMDTRMPLLPKDFDERFHISVPPDQWSTTPLRGDEMFEVEGATLEGAWRFQIPRFLPGFSSFGQTGRVEHRTHLDTILIDADAYRVELTWRASVPLPRKHEMLERVRIFEKTLV